MTRPDQLLLVAVMVLIGMLFGYLIARQNFVIRRSIINKKLMTNMDVVNALYIKETHEKILLKSELEALKVWATDADIYIEELEVENLALNGTKSRAKLTYPENESLTKEPKKVVHKSTRKAK